MALTDRDTGERPASRNPQPSAREKLQDHNARSRAEYENSLLKEALTEYMEQFEKLKNEQNAFLQQAEQSLQQERQRNEQQMNKLQESVRSLRNANEILSQNMSKSITAMTSDVKAATVQTVQEGLKANTDALGSATKKIADYEKTVIKSMKERLETFEDQKRRLFAFDSLRTAIFWAGCISNFVTLLLLFYFLFFRG